LQGPGGKKQNVSWDWVGEKRWGSDHIPKNGGRQSREKPHHFTRRETSKSEIRKVLSVEEDGPSSRKEGKKARQGKKERNSPRKIELKSAGKPAGC